MTDMKIPCSLRGLVALLKERKQLDDEKKELLAALRKFWPTKDIADTSLESLTTAFHVIVKHGGFE